MLDVFTIHEGITSHAVLLDFFTAEPQTSPRPPPPSPRKRPSKRPKPNISAFQALLAELGPPPQAKIPANLPKPPSFRRPSRPKPAFRPTTLQTLPTSTADPLSLIEETEEKEAPFHHQVPNRPNLVRPKSQRPKLEIVRTNSFPSFPTEFPPPAGGKHRVAPFADKGFTRSLH